MKWLIELLKKIMKYLTDIIEEIFTWCHTVLEAPTLLSATVVPPNIELEWTDNATNNTCYMIWRSVDGTNFTLIDTINESDLEGYIDTTAVMGVTYWYKVQACDGDGNTSDFSNTVETGTTFTAINFGLLYNWHAVNTGILAPTGWHIPTTADFWALKQEQDFGARETFNNNVAGGKLKEAGLTYWDTPNTGATNEVGFNARGHGLRNYTTGLFSLIKNQGRYWNAGQYNADQAYISVLRYDNAILLTSTDPLWGHSYHYKTSGEGVRCIKDDAVDPGAVTDYDGNVYPTVTIGTQVWMAQNLIVKHYNDGTAIPEVTDAGTWAALGTGAWCYYNNDPNNM